MTTCAFELVDKAVPVCVGCDGTGLRSGGAAVAAGLTGAGHRVGGFSPPT